MTEISFTQIVEALRKKRLPDCEHVVAIADGGIVPASLTACRLGCDLSIVHFNYRDRKNRPQHREPVLLNKVKLPVNVKKILIVDDVSVSGKTLSAAKRLFSDYQVHTFVFKGKADYVLLPEIADCINWPWSACA